MPYVAVIQFREGGPRVTGTWDEQEPAERRWTSWVGLYGSAPGALVSLVEQTPDGTERLVKRWPPRGDEQQAR
ncbi:hypothetical protein ABZ135_23385 [Streptomyces sp. NPDC006339]|uniref:hypothetical protein n=1 Tax=Streptomyces sp. NPDC006339 TaxID=3156755 RepID=UPI0033AEEFD1